MSFLATPLGYLLGFFYDVTGHYWAAIIIVSLIARIAMYPVYKKQIMSTAGMADLQPKMQELQKKYKNDPDMYQQKVSELYKESGASPAAGCLPMAIQLIIIAGLFALLRNPLNYLTDESMVFAIHESFLWIKDLSQPDPWILPLATGVVTFLAQITNSQMNSSNQAGGQAMSMMKYVFPLMIVWLSRSYPSGLAIYWFISQVTQIFFNFRFNQIRKDLKANNNKSKKKKKAKATA